MVAYSLARVCSRPWPIHQCDSPPGPLVLTPAAHTAREPGAAAQAPTLHSTLCSQMMTPAGLLEGEAMSVAPEPCRRFERHPLPVVWEIATALPLNNTTGLVFNDQNIASIQITTGIQIWLSLCTGSSSSCLNISRDAFIAGQPAESLVVEIRSANETA